MAKLETQYQDYINSNPESQLSYEEWISMRFSTPPDAIHSLQPMTPPYVSDNFQIGPQGAFEHDDSDITDWDITLQDGLEEFPWDNEE